MILEQDGFRFDFGTDRAFIFDEKDPNSSHFHQAPMKAVDLIVELEDRYYFVELKDYSNPQTWNEILTNRRQTPEEMVNWLKEILKSKFRDTFLYRWAEIVPEKDVFFICLIDTGAFSLGPLTNSLRRELPVGLHDDWKRAIVKNCFVMNPERWNQTFPKWKVEKMPGN